MGLGLSICHSIIKKHDGHITAESAPAAGTTFHFYLPASQTQVIEEEAPVTERPMASRGSILVMDDEELVRNVAGQMLTRLGYDVAFAKDGSEAIEMYKKAMKSKKCFDAVILDLTVKGGMGGKETVKKLLEIDSDVKAILSSGYSDDPAMTDFRKHAFCSTIVKPYDIDI
ncbi:MAG: response regulator [Deltaproteobacteria bacterium]|nr:response regulator [Deltaproteobacteria bacterium]